MKKMNVQERNNDILPPDNFTPSSKLTNLPQQVLHYKVLDHLNTKTIPWQHRILRQRGLH